jgi:hypothetical protein
MPVLWRDPYLDQQAIDTTTPAGRMFFHITGAFADDAERVLMRSHALYPERTAA